ncbi:hypothetical protein ACX9I7_27285 [Streptomyces sp. L500]|uniref:hypothetical protein n=1 Tax=Streptomyces abikoensis TaxID=97398 RepID=UPI0036C15058
MALIGTDAQTRMTAQQLPQASIFGMREIFPVSTLAASAPSCLIGSGDGAPEPSGLDLARVALQQARPATQRRRQGNVA